MKIILPKYSVSIGLVLLLAACSTKRNSWLSRNSHALSTEYNILYNGGLAMDAGIVEVKTTYNDNFWEQLPIERMQVSKDAMTPGETPNANFERAETKAIKAIQKHSMNIDGGEKNPRMDEAHLMLGKARYYDQRFIPALEAFNYILYKYPSSDKIYEAKIWREKTNIRMENDQLAVNNLRKLLSEIKFKDQIFADANAILAQAFLNLEQKDSAVVRLKRATEFTKQNEEKARYRFILGQLYEKLGYKDSAYAAYQSVIEMNRKSPRQYVINAYNRQSMQFDFEKGDTVAFLKTYNKLLQDRENRPYLGPINHQMGLFYDKNKKYSQAEKFYKESLKSKQDQYLTASNYRNLADIYFNNARYVAAGTYYDSTLVTLNARGREHKLIKKKRENLVDVIKYEGIAKVNDSILRVTALSPNQQTAFFETYIAKLKKDDEIRKAKQEKEKEQAASDGKFDENDGKTNNGMAGEDVVSGKGIVSGKNAPKPQPAGQPIAASSGGKDSDFYFYNPTTVAFGKAEFRKNWGDRTLQENWRVASIAANSAVAKGNDVKNNDDNEVVADGKAATEDELYSVGYYLNRIPKSKTETDSIVKERNFAYYQLGVIYKEKFREYKLSADKLEALLTYNPEERLVLPSLYNLFKIYEITDPAKAQAMKSKIISQYPESRYAQILGNTNSESIASLSPDIAYNNLFKQYENGDYKNALVASEAAVDQFTGDEIVSKFELLKARTVGKLNGLAEYKKSLNFVALNYPNTPEGKEAETLLGKDIPALNNLKFSRSETSNWKILYRAKNLEDKGTKYIQEKIKKFLTDRKSEKLGTSFDIYTMSENLIVIHGMPSEEYAKGIASILKEFKEYKISDTPIIISGQNYEIVQMKKNLEEYLASPVYVDISVTNQLPFTPPAPVANQPPPVQTKNAINKAMQQTTNPAKTQPPANSQQPGKSQTPGKNTNPGVPSQPPGQLGGPPPSPQMEAPKR